MLHVLKIRSINIVFLWILFLSCKEQSHHFPIDKNYIENIQNAQQIVDLLTFVDERYKTFEVNEKMKFNDSLCQVYCDSLHVQPWQKVDVDQNGLTDIVVYGDWVEPSILCILNKGEKYEIKYLTRDVFQRASFVIVQNNILKFYYKSALDSTGNNGNKKFNQKNLVYKYGDFIEENIQHVNHKIERIEYATSACFGTCPIFKLVINSDKSAIFQADDYNRINIVTLKGIYKTIITDEKYNELVELLNYIDFESLKDNYAVTWTDDQSSKLTITYNNGKVKTIDDYGLLGTFGLNKVYQMLFEMRENQKWKK